MNLASSFESLGGGCRDKALLHDWHVVAFSADLSSRKPVPLTLFERDFVAWRDTAGQVHVWDDLCVHRGARLSKGLIRDDHLVCPYHGWHYDGSAQCVRMPASPDEKPLPEARATAHHVAEKYGLTWICLGEPAGDVPAFAEWHDDSYKKVVCGPYRFKSGYRAVENFFDPTHFPFVHAGVNGVFDAPDPIPPYEVIETAEGLETSEIRVTQPFGDPRGIPVTSYYAYKCLRPLVAYFRKRVVATDPALGRSNSAEFFNTLFTAQAVGPVDSIVRIVCAMNVAPPPSDEDVRRRQELVYAQDAAIVDIQRPERIPLDLHHELHHRTDLLSLKYRNWLRGMDITYGAV